MQFPFVPGFNLNDNDYGNIESRALVYHRTLEAFKFAFARRQFLGDIEFADSEVRDVGTSTMITNNLMSLCVQWIDLLMNGIYCDHIRSLINDTSVLDDYSPDGSAQEVMSPFAEGTTHLNAVGADGLAVSATATVGAQ
jgi:gamma-glutamyltranspeptidase